jgi:hypothetical protein
VVLSANPVKVDPAAIKDIQVLQTLKEGQVVYTRPASAPVKTAQIPASVHGEDTHPPAGPERALTERDRQTLAALVEAGAQD